VKGFVPTPRAVVDGMVAKLFSDRPPEADSTVLDPGCGTGAFIEGIVRWCRRHHRPVPRVLGIESDPRHLVEVRRSLGRLKSVSIVNEDFLARRSELFDYIVGNPPYVPITALSDLERATYRKGFRTATGRFDLYLLFFEQAVRLLKPGGRLVFITPEKFLYVRTAEPLRQVLAALAIEEIHFLPETTFGELVTYPTVTTVVSTPPRGKTTVILRDGSTRRVRIPGDGSSWLPVLNGAVADRPHHSLGEVCLRISCGVATGADAVYIAKTSHLPANLKRFAFPTISGREMAFGKSLAISHAMLVPYTANGELLREEQLGELGTYLSEPDRRSRLLKRTCVRHKQWYAFHENPPLPDILRPKLLCKDITSRPFFVIDETGEIVPRHSVYYLVPKDPSCLMELCEYLNSKAAQAWLTARCQRAANGFFRLQSHVLKRMPVPPEFAAAAQLTLYESELASV
jgi:adenine-specific DNA-methyltransferase